MLKYSYSLDESVSESDVSASDFMKLDKAEIASVVKEVTGKDSSITLAQSATSEDGVKGGVKNTVTVSMSGKNTIAEDAGEQVAQKLSEKYPKVQVRFVLTFTENEMPVPHDVRDSFVFIGRVNVAECPSLYEQCDMMFMPSLLECFTACYPEAMRMEKPIVTTDMAFAKGLCGNAACYYSAVDSVAAAEAIYKVATNKDYARQLIENGKKQLKTFYNYSQRAEKLISILEKISK